TVVFSIVVLALGYRLHLLAEPPVVGQEVEKPHYWWQLASHIANELGIAGLIAMVLVFTIDRLTRKESAELATHHQQRMKEIADETERAIKTNVSHYVSGHAFPDVVVAEIKSQLLPRCFLRHNQKITHEISPSTMPEYLTLLTTMEYEIENISHNEQDYP